MLKQITRFALVGLLNTAIDFGVLNLLIQIFHWAVLPANVVSFSAAVTNSYFWTKHWTFQDKSHRNWWQFGCFVVVNLIGLGLSSIILYWGLLWAPSWTTLSFNWQYNIVKAISVVIVWVWNFLVYKFWLFNDRSKSTPSFGSHPDL